MTYAEAMRRFGTDRPDLRFGMEIRDWTGPAAAAGFGVFEGAVAAGGVVRGIVVPGRGGGRQPQGRRRADGGGARAGRQGPGLGGGRGRTGRSARRWRGSSDGLAGDLGAAPGDLVLLVADAEPVAQRVLGALRIRMAERHGLIPEGAWAPLWVVDFPLVGWNADEGRWDPLHHPFTAPRPEDLDRLEPTPARCCRRPTTWC